MSDTTPTVPVPIDQLVALFAVEAAASTWTAIIDDNGTHILANITRQHRAAVRLRAITRHYDQVHSITGEVGTR